MRPRLYPFFFLPLLVAAATLAAHSVPGAAYGKYSNSDSADELGNGRCGEQFFVQGPLGGQFLQKAYEHRRYDGGS